MGASLSFITSSKKESIKDKSQMNYCHTQTLAINHKRPPCIPPYHICPQPMGRIWQKLELAQPIVSWHFITCTGLPTLGHQPWFLVAATKQPTIQRSFVEGLRLGHGAYWCTPYLWLFTCTKGPNSWKTFGAARWVQNARGDSDSYPVIAWAAWNAS
jgi:hypothetical protein